VNEDLNLEDAAKQANAILVQSLQSLGQNLVGLEEVITQTLITLVAGGHALLEGVPGTAKTTLCRFLSTVLGLEYRRIQFTPDLLPTDVTGTKIFDQSKNEFVLQKGPVFCQFLLADELNRAPARTQSSLLEAMQEGQVTIEGETLPLPKPFIVLATQNPVEQEGVYRLPEAQLDRFLFRIHVGYPDREGEIQLLEVHEKPSVELVELWNAEKIQLLQSAVNKVFCNLELKEYMIDLIRASRNHQDVLLGASPRAAIYLQKAARARALMAGRTFFTHEDVQSMAYSVLEHRIIMRPEAELSGRSAKHVISELIQSVPVRAG
jgi:MoxR-like ATPase